MTVGPVQFMNEFIEFMSSFRIKSRCRFIEDQNFRIGCQDTGNDQALPLPARKIRQTTFTKFRKSDFFQRFINGHGNLFGTHSHIFQRKGDFFFNRHSNKLAVVIIQHGAHMLG